MLLSLESTYPPAHQLSLDMLKVGPRAHTRAHAHGPQVCTIVSRLSSVQRLSTANDEIVEVLLSKHQVLAALRFIRSVGTSGLRVHQNHTGSSLGVGGNLQCD